MIGENKKDDWGYIDKKGQVAIAPRYHYAGRFSNGLGRVLVATESGLLWGYIDNSSQMVVPPYLLTAEDFSDGLALVYVQLVDGSRKYGYIGR